MVRVECEKCLKLIKISEMLHLHVMEATEHGTSTGSYVYYAGICEQCAIDLLQSFKAKLIDINKDHAEKYHQNNEKRN